MWTILFKVLVNKLSFLRNLSLTVRWITFWKESLTQPLFISFNCNCDTNGMAFLTICRTGGKQTTVIGKNIIQE